MVRHAQAIRNYSKNPPKHTHAEEMPAHQRRPNNVSLLLMPNPRARPLSNALTDGVTAQGEASGSASRLGKALQRRTKRLRGIMFVVHEPQQQPPTRAPYRHLTRSPHTHHTAPYAARTPGTDKAARHPPQAQQEPARRTHH